jgi:drug/metabolite transporter (DMT)-like permease
MTPAVTMVLSVLMGQERLGFLLVASVLLIAVGTGWVAALRPRRRS